MLRWRARAHARAWRCARGFDDLCALGARFVAGELAAFPGWGAPALDDESVPLVPALVACHRAGFLTLASQPSLARAEPAGVRVQRAFVVGFASEPALAALTALAREAPGVEVAVERADGPGPAARALAWLDGAPYLWMESGARRDELALLAGAVSREARAELASLPLVWVLGPPLHGGHEGHEGHEGREPWRSLERLAPRASTLRNLDRAAHSEPPRP